MSKGRRKVDTFVKAGEIETPTPEIEITVDPVEAPVEVEADTKERCPACCLIYKMEQVTEGKRAFKKCTGCGYLRDVV